MQLKHFLLSGLVGLVPSTHAVAQNLPETAEISQTARDQANEENPVGFSKGGFVMAPIPIKNPTVGAGLALGGGYLFNMDRASGSSYLGLGAFKTDNGSSGYGLSGDVTWDDNRWNLGMTLAQVNVVYDYYLGGLNGVRIPLKQDGKLLDLNLKYGFTKEFQVGLNLGYIESNIGLNIPGVLPPEPDKASDISILKFGPTIALDYRDNSFYPTNGSHLFVKALYNKLDSKIGDGEYFKTTVKFDAYTTLGENLVIATRAAACSAESHAPFFDKCGLGAVDSFRGYAFGAVLDNTLLSFQTELRGRFTERFGYAVFAGLGDAKEDFSSFSLEEAKVSAGAGVRIRLSKKFPMDFSIDAARTTKGDDTLYVYVGQRF